MTCKLRLGWDDSSIVAPYLARRLEQIGVALVAIHGRTTEMRFSGQARLDGIAEVVQAVKKIPVIGNGDIKTPADAVRMLDYTGCAGVMIGRGAISAPWIFRDTWLLLTQGFVPAEPTLHEKIQTMHHHFANILKFRGERQAIMEFRKRISWYAKHLTPCKQLKEEMRRLRSPEHFEQILNRFLEWRCERAGAGQLARNAGPGLG
jgi:nifR3 family TIM-barrel protein